MKKAINIWSFNDMGISASMEMAKKFGFAGIELAFNETGEMSLESKESEILEYRKNAADIGIELTSLASGLGWKTPLTSDDIEIRRKAKDIVKRQIEAAAILGVDTILVVPGAVGVDFIPNFPVVSYELAYNRALEAITELAGDAKKAGVYIGVENVWNKLLISPLEMRDFIDKTDSWFVGAYFDIGNVVYAGYPEHWIEILGERIKKVHVKDYSRENGFVDLLKGDVDFVRAIQALKAVKYDDFLVAEVSTNNDKLQESIREISESMDKIING